MPHTNGPHHLCWYTPGWGKYKTRNRILTVKSIDNKRGNILPPPHMKPGWVKEQFPASSYYRHFLYLELGWVVNGGRETRGFGGAINRMPWEDPIGGLWGKSVMPKRNVANDVKDSCENHVTCWVTWQSCAFAWKGHVPQEYIFCCVYTPVQRLTWEGEEEGGWWGRWRGDLWEGAVREREDTI